MSAYTFLKNPTHLSETKLQQLVVRIRLYQALGLAYRLKTLINDQVGHAWADKPAA